MESVYSVVITPEENEYDHMQFIVASYSGLSDD